MKFFNNLQTVFTNTEKGNQHEDSGDLVQTVLITAGFAVTAVLIIAWYANSIAAQGARMSDCLSGAGSVDNSHVNAVENCDDNSLPEKAAEQNDEEYNKRFGTTE